MKSFLKIIIGLLSLFKVIACMDFDVEELPANTKSQLGSNVDIRTEDYLSLPFNTSDLSFDNFGIVSPFGIVRRELDSKEKGHSGIDLPLKANAPIFAVADAVIIDIKAHEKVASVIKLLLYANSGDSNSSGDVFIYESVKPVFGLELGQQVESGELIAHNPNPAPPSNHLEQSFQESGFLHKQQCWIKNLEESARTEFNKKFNELVADPFFKESWSSATTDGTKPLIGLLDKSKFPAGPQPCYEPGTDVR